MESQQQDERPTSQPHSCRRFCRGKSAHREEGGQLDHQSVRSHSFQADSREATRVQNCQSVQLTGVTHPPKVTYFSDHNNCYCTSPSRTTTPSQNEISANLPKHLLDCKGHGHKAIVYKGHFPPLRQFMLETPPRILGT